MHYLAGYFVSNWEDMLHCAYINLVSAFHLLRIADNIRTYIEMLTDC